MPVGEAISLPQTLPVGAMQWDDMSVRWSAALGIIVGSYYVGNAVLVPMFV